MTAFEVAEFVGCHEETVRRAYLRGLLASHKWVGSSMHDRDRLIGALETCCRQGEMLRIQNRHVDWEQHQVAIPGSNAKDGENRRIPFDPRGRLAPTLKRRAALGPNAYVFGTESGEFQESFKTAWEALLLRASGYETKRMKPGRGLIATGPGFDRSTCTGTTCVTKAPAACWRTASTSARSS